MATAKRNWHLEKEILEVTCTEQYRLLLTLTSWYKGKAPQLDIRKWYINRDDLSEYPSKDGLALDDMEAATLAGIIDAYFRHDLTETENEIKISITNASNKGVAIISEGDGKYRFYLTEWEWDKNSDEEYYVRTLNLSSVEAAKLAVAIISYLQATETGPRQYTLAVPSPAAIRQYLEENGTK